MSLLSLVAFALAPAATMPRQIGPITHRTVETILARSDAAFRGVIVDCKRVVTVPRDGKREGSSYPDGFADVTLTVRVDEVFKGKPGKRVVLTRETTATDERYGSWADQKTEFLWVLPAGPRSRSLNDWSHVRIGAPVRAEWLYRSSSLPLLSNEFKIVRTQAEFLRVARAFARQARKPWPFATVDLPWNLAWGSPENGIRMADGTYVQVVVTPRVIETAFEFILHPERWEPNGPAAQPQMEELRNDPAFVRSSLEANRRIGATLLSVATDDRTIRRLKALLRDPTVHREGGELVYPVRQIARELLKQAGLSVEKPSSR